MRVYALLEGMKQDMSTHSLLRIGEFARLGQVSVATLRYYDQEGLLKPNTLDPDTGYRYYSPNQLPRLHRIIVLKELGFPLDQIALLLEKALSIEQLQEMFQLQYAQTLQMIETEQQRLLRIAARLRHIEQEGTMPNYDIRVKPITPLLVASIREIVPLGADLGRSYPLLADYLKQCQVQQVLPAMRLLYSHYKWYGNEMGIDIETAIPLLIEIPPTEQVRVHTLDGGQVAYTLHTGSDIALGQAHTALHRWIEENRYTIVGPPRQIHLQRSSDMVQSACVTEVQFPVETSLHHTARHIITLGEEPPNTVA